MGCQENMLNEPSEALLKQNDNLVTTDVIKLECDLRDPSYGISKLCGQVSYTFQVITEAMNPMALNRVAIHISINAELDDMYGMMHLEWRIQGRSDDVVTVSEEGIVLIDKCYSITNRSDVVLLVQYLVTTNGIGISNVNLAPLEK
ncbi:MAG TPA: hypothetical protein VLH59_15735 [Ignavibacteriaceae bacterium]|nr:hypothetical protein [Ignavibacteriaceae bacterium]